MPVEDDFKEFNLWAKSLGCPTEFLPSEEALKSKFRSPQGMILKSLIEKVRSRQEVKAVKDNILLSKMGQIKEQVFPTTMRASLPKEMQRYLEMEDLNKKKAELQTKLNEKKLDFDKIYSRIRTKNIQKVQLMHKKEKLQTKVNLLEIKSDQLSQAIEKEVTKKQKILSALPVRITPSNGSEAAALNIVNEAAVELERFYQIFSSNSNGLVIQEAKTELWAKLRKIFADSPNYLLWTSLMKLMDDNINRVSTLSNMSFDALTIRSEENLSVLEIEILKAQAFVISIYSDAGLAITEYDSQVQKFVVHYKQFVEALKCKLNLFCSEDSDDVDEVLSDFVVQYTARDFNKGQIMFLKNELDNFKRQIADGDIIQKENQMVLGSVKQIYDEIDFCVRRIQGEVSSMHQIKDKIVYTRKLLQYMFQDSQPSQNQFSTNKFNINGSIELSSFDISDNVFCSTKLESENCIDITSVGAFNNSFRSDISMAAPQSLLPNYAQEINLFLETPLDRILTLPQECYFHLRPNPLIIDSTESLSLIQLTPGHLLTPNGSINEVRLRCKLYEELKKYTSEIKPDIILVEVNKDELRLRQIKQHEEIIELLAKIDVIGVNTKQMIQKISKYIKFLTDNPLNNYVPPTKLFNGRTYTDYESEFLMYYRMVKADSTTND